VDVPGVTPILTASRGATVKCAHLTSYPDETAFFPTTVKLIWLLPATIPCGSWTGAANCGVGEYRSMVKFGMAVPFNVTETIPQLGPVRN
jgi:hypothetical protein